MCVSSRSSIKEKIKEGGGGSPAMSPITGHQLPEICTSRYIFPLLFSFLSHRFSLYSSTSFENLPSSSSILVDSTLEFLLLVFASEICPFSHHGHHHYRRNPVSDEQLLMPDSCSHVAAQISGNNFLRNISLRRNFNSRQGAEREWRQGRKNRT